MAILAECPSCHQKQSNRNKKCRCDEDLVKAKRSMRVNYWISYYLPNGKNRRELVGKKLADAQAAEGKRKAQKKENRLFDIVPDSSITFSNLFNWYVGLKSFQEIPSAPRFKTCLKNFEKIYGSKKVGDIRVEDLEEYKFIRKKEGRALKTIDMEIKQAQTAINRAIANDKIDSRPLKAFKNFKNLVPFGSNARKRKMSLEEYVELLDVSSGNLKIFLIVAMNTGMRSGEIRQLKWSQVDEKNMFIRLNKENTKEKKEKNIPINKSVLTALNEIPRCSNMEFIFHYRGKPLTKSESIRLALIKACGKCGIIYGRKKKNGLVFHDTRRSVKTNMVKAGLDVVYRNVLLGHSLEGMDAHYITFDDEELTSAMEIYTNWFDKQMKQILEK